MPRLHACLLALMALVYLATVPFSIMHLDLARDVGRGLDIARGVALPTEGPILASTIHLGPLWYYMLAVPMLVTPSWLAAVLFVGALAALKLPLAYALGTRLADRRVGLLWALMLLYPGWMTFESIVQNHASLVATCALAAMWTLVTFVQQGRLPRLAWTGLFFGLALHAHPSAIGLGPIIVAGIVLRQRHEARFSLLQFVVTGLAAMVPFTPFLFAQALAGFPDFARARDFVGDPASVGSLGAVASLLRAVFLGGVDVVARDFLASVAAAPNVARIVTLALLATSAAGIVAGMIQTRTRELILAGSSATLAAAVAVALVRAQTPYYMTFVVWALAAGVVALGLRSADRIPIVRPLGRIVVGFAAALIIVSQASVARALENGTWRFAFFPLFDVKLPHRAGEAMPFMPAHASAASGRFLCAQSSMTAHGSYAVHLFHTYAIDARLQCRQTAMITLGGAGAAIAWTGLSRTLARELGIEASHGLGSIALVRASRSVTPVVGAAVPDPGRYPPMAPVFGAATTQAYEFEAAPDEAVLVTDAYFAFVTPPAVSATANGAPVPPVARDLVSAAYLCRSCPPRTPVRWRLDITTAAVDRVDIVTVATTRAP